MPISGTAGCKWMSIHVSDLCVRMPSTSRWNVSTSVHPKRVLLPTQEPSNYGHPLVPMFRSKVMPPSSGWLNCFICILTWYRGHQPAINVIKVGGMHTEHVSFPCSLYPYLYTKHIARLKWKLWNNSQDCVYADRFPVSAEDILVFISRSCTTCSNMALGRGEAKGRCGPCFVLTLCPGICPTTK